MVETTMASQVANWPAMIPGVFSQLQLAVGCILLAVSAVSAGLALHRGIGTALGKLVGGCAIAALAFGLLSLVHTIDFTVNSHAGGTILNDTDFLPPDPG
jgi:predicted ABC-type sugar transport system permease subunit